VQEPGPFYSTLQPFTYVSEDGTVGTLFHNDELLSPFRCPADLPIDLIRMPDMIVGPAVVSHDSSWRLTNNALIYASARTGPKKESGPNTPPDDDSDNEDNVEGDGPGPVSMEQSATHSDTEC
jgi:hypothetical protein